MSRDLTHSNLTKSLIRLEHRFTRQFSHLQQSILFPLMFWWTEYLHEAVNLVKKHTHFFLLADLRQDVGNHIITEKENEKMYAASNKLLTSFQPVRFALKITPNQLCFLSSSFGFARIAFFSLCLVKMSVTRSCILCLCLALWDYTVHSRLQNIQQKSGSPKSKEFELQKS